MMHARTLQISLLLTALYGDIRCLDTPKEMYGRENRRRFDCGIPLELNTVDRSISGNSASNICQDP
jgi:hypothetical protein